MQEDLEIQRLNMEKEKIEISKLIEENKRIEQENNRKRLELESQQLELKKKELEEMKQSLQSTNNSTQIERSFFNSNPIHFPLLKNILFNFTFCVWFKTSQPNVGISAIYDKEFGSGGHDRHIGLKNGMPYVRTWKGPGYTASRPCNDNLWHHFAYTCATGQGQIL